MIPWANAPEPILAGIHTVVTDVDDTLTRDGRLEGPVIAALDRLLHAGIRVVPTTAASAGWGSLMASMWPVDAVIAENGGVSFVRREGKVDRRFHAGGRPDLARLSDSLHRLFPALVPADDQPYRESSLAFRRLADGNSSVLEQLPALGAKGTANSLWLLAWPGPWDKLTAARQLLAEEWGINLSIERERVLYVGDSENDQAMFAALPYTVGVSTVTKHRLEVLPRWITAGPGGPGFVEVADRLLAARHWP